MITARSAASAAAHPSAPQTVLKQLARVSARVGYRWQVCTIAAGEPLTDCEHGPFASREVAAFFAKFLNDAEAINPGSVPALLARALRDRDTPDIATLRARHGGDGADEPAHTRTETRERVTFDVIDCDTKTIETVPPMERLQDAAAALSVAAFLAAGALACFGLSEARAHQAPSGWTYDAACCSTMDCAPVPASSVIATPDGWRVTLEPGEHPLVKRRAEWLVPYGSSKEKPSPDGAFHACVGAKTGVLFCLYRPEMGA